MARGFETGSDNERIDEIQKQLDDVLDSQINAVGGNENISIDSTRGSRNNAGGDEGGVRSNEPIVHQITDIDEDEVSTGIFDKINIISSMAIIDHTSTPITLRFIQGTVKDGARIKITPKIGKTIDVEPGGNILTLSTITITDDDYYELVKYSEAETGVTGGAFKILLTGVGGGGGFTDPLTQLLITLSTATLPSTTTVDTSVATEFQITLDENIEFDFTGGPAIGRDQVLTIFIIQDGTGGFTVDWGAKVPNPPVIGLSPNESTTVVLVSRDQGVTWKVEAAAGGGSTLPVVDTTSIVKGSVDPTKEMRFEIDAFDTGTTRVMTLPNADVTLAGLEVVSQTWTGENIFIGDVEVVDLDFFIKDNSDPTKVARFNSSLITTGTTRNYSLPNSSTTLAGLGVTSQTWTGENIFVGNTAIRDTNFFIQDGADITKQLNFALEGGTPGFVLTLASVITGNRTLTFPDITTDLAGLDVIEQTWTGQHVFIDDVTVIDTNFLIESSDESSDIILFDASLVNGTRTITIPDSSTTMAGLGVTLQTWTGTNIFVGNTAIRDTNFFVQDGGDITKQLNFALEGGTTGFVLTLASVITGNRTLTFPDSSTTIAGLGVTSQTWTGTNDFVGITTVIDSNFGIRDFSDNSKVINFDASLITTATTRVYSLPDSTTTLAGLGVLSQSWTGTNIFVGITNIRTDNNFVMQDPTDPTKQVIWDLSGVSTSTTRTITMPDNDVTLGAGGGASPLTTKGDIFTFDTADARLPVGTNGQVLTANSAVALGVEWSAVGADLLPLTNTWTGINTYTNQVNLNSTVVIGDQTTDLIQGVGRLANAKSWIPAVDLGSDLGTNALSFGSVYSRNLFLDDPNTHIKFASNNMQLTSSSGNDIVFLEDITEFGRMDGGLNEIIWLRETEFNSNIRIDGGNMIHAHDSVECGFAVTDDITSPGSFGTIQIPVNTGNIASAAGADTDFGAAIGCIGMYREGVGTPTLVIKIDTSPSTWAVLVLNAAGNIGAGRLT